MTERQLILGDGIIFAGIGFGAEKDSMREVVFNTSMTGNHGDNLVTVGRFRRESVEHGIVFLRNLDTVKAILNVIDATTFSVKPMIDKRAVPL
ncbi:carbamoyl-phosphate synthase domain-containing protein [Lentibacillus sp.]|uniref:carbamoyl-phosphate synthase domain-containing protein n=1 Tax=Lentibacillus sp. TaxID=1925746 RepID=UPI0039C95806